MKKVAERSRDSGRGSRDCRPTVKQHFFRRSKTFFKKISNCLKRPKIVVWQSADSRVTSTTVAWPFSDFFKIFQNCLKRPKNVVWQSADGRVTSDHCRVTVQRLFSKKFLIAWNVQKSLFDSRPTVAWPQPLSRDLSAQLENFLKKVAERSRDSGRRSRDRRPTVKQRFLDVSSNFGKFWKSRWTVTRQWLRSRDCRPTVKQRFLDVSSN